MNYHRSDFFFCFLQRPWTVYSNMQIGRHLCLVLIVFREVFPGIFGSYRLNRFSDRYLPTLRKSLKTRGGHFRHFPLLFLYHGLGVFSKGCFDLAVVASI